MVPYLREKVAATCDLSDFIEQPLEEFEDFDWSLMMKLLNGRKGIYWLSEELEDVEEMKEIKKLQEVEEQKSEIVKKMEEYIKREIKDRNLRIIRKKSSKVSKFSRKVLTN